jgi:chromosome partitioning related protein ParA
MYVLSIISTKGGVGKTTVTANLGAVLADAGLRVLLIDLDSQPTLSSYFSLTSRAPCGTLELIAQHQLEPRQIVSRTEIAGLDLIRSNDPTGQLATLLLHAPDGRVRLRNLLPRLASAYDLVLIDTQGSRSVVLEMAVLAADRALSPVLPEMLADLQPLQRMGIRTPALALLLNRTEGISNDGRLITAGLRRSFSHTPPLLLLNTSIPGLVAYRQAATLGLPAHRFEPRQPHGRKAPSCLSSLQALAIELFPQWRQQLAQLTLDAGDRQ